VQLIYFSPVPWASFRQRPHEFADWFHHRWNARVLWIEPYPVRLPRKSDWSRPALQGSGDAGVPDWLEQLRPMGLPLEPLAAGRWLNRVLAWPAVLARVREFSAADRTVLAIGKPSDLALQALRATPAAISLYDAMDDFAAFHSGLARSVCASIEAEIVRRCKVLSTSSTAIASRLRCQGFSVHCIPNGLAAGRMPPPANSAGGSVGGFGYVGTIGAWFDWPWVAELATSWPERSVEIYGPRYSRPSGSLPANVTLFPPMPHDLALERMRGFAAGLIPFMRTELTESVDPVKYYEYRGLGLPVISTPFGEMATRAAEPRVVLTAQPAKARAEIARLLENGDTAKSIADFRLHNDWRGRFEPLASTFDPNS
jgi:hypothetical protein